MNQRDVLFNVIAWNFDELQRCANPNMIKERQRYIRNMQECEKKIKELDDGG